MKEDIIAVKSLSLLLGNTLIHQNINFQIKKGEIAAIIGASGCGKTSLLKEMLSLLKPRAGSIEIFGKNITTLSKKALQNIQIRCGVLFQQGALFSSLSVLENIVFPLKQFTTLNKDSMIEIAVLKLSLAGLSPDVLHKYPAQLSGGMQKRVALARALVLDPELLFLDEPASGLDPISSAMQDNLLLNLQENLKFTIVMVTHDMNTLKNIANHIIFLGEKKILAEGSFQALENHPHPEVFNYFHSNHLFTGEK